MAAPSATASAAPAPEPNPVQWEVPPTWRNMGVPYQGITRARFQVIYEPQTTGPAEEVSLYVVQHFAARGDTPEARTEDAASGEAKAFVHVDTKTRSTRMVGGRKVLVVELHGTMRQMISVPPDGDEKVVERAHQAELTAIVPTKTYPYRVAMHGREDLVERAREDFFRFVDSLRIAD